MIIMGEGGELGHLRPFVIYREKKKGDGNYQMNHGLLLLSISSHQVQVTYCRITMSFLLVHSNLCQIPYLAVAAA